MQHQQGTTHYTQCACACAMSGATLALAAAMLCSSVRPSYVSRAGSVPSGLLGRGLQTKVCSCCLRSSPSAKSAAVKICSSGMEQVPASRPMAAPLSNAVSMNSVMPAVALFMATLWYSARLAAEVLPHAYSQLIMHFAAVQGLAC